MNTNKNTLENNNNIIKDKNTNLKDLSTMSKFKQVYNEEDKIKDSTVKTFEEVNLGDKSEIVEILGQLNLDSENSSSKYF